MSGSHHSPEQQAVVIEKVLDGLKKGGPEYNAAEAAGISFETWWRWRKSVPGLQERADKAKESRVLLLEDALYKVALKGSVTAILALLEKFDRGWRDRAKEIAPQQNTFVFNGNAALMIKMMPEDKRLKFLNNLKSSGLLPDRVLEIKADEPTGT